jgi:hypothetical protein
MANNMNVILAAVLQVVDTKVSPSATIIQRSLNNPTLDAVVTFYDPFFQVTNVATTVPLPAATIWVCYVKNLDVAANITVTFTPTGGGAETCVLVPGGLFIYFQPTEGAGGITALTLTSSAATIPACVLLAK